MSPSGDKKFDNTAAYWQKQFDDESARFGDACGDNGNDTDNDCGNDGSASIARSNREQQRQQQQEQQQQRRDARAKRRAAQGMGMGISGDLEEETSRVNTQAQAQVQAATQPVARASRRTSLTQRGKQDSGDSIEVPGLAAYSSNTAATSARAAHSNTTADVEEKRRQVMESKTRIASLEQQLMTGNDEQQQNYAQALQDDDDDDDDDEQKPGAWSVPGPSFAPQESAAMSVSTMGSMSATAAELDRSASLRLEGSSRSFLPQQLQHLQQQQNQMQGHNTPNTSSSNHHMSTDGILAVAAVVVDEDQMEQERESLSLKQQQLLEQEQRLAQQAAKLKAWEDELQRKQAQMDYEATTPAALPLDDNHSHHHKPARPARQKSWRGMFGTGSQHQRSRTPPRPGRRQSLSRAITYHGEDTRTLRRRRSSLGTGAGQPQSLPQGSQHQPTMAHQNSSRTIDTTTSPRPSRRPSSDHSSLLPSIFQRATSLDATALLGTVATTSNAGSSHQRSSSSGFFDSFHNLHNSFQTSGHDSECMSLFADTAATANSQQHMDIVDAQVLRASQVINAQAVSALADLDLNLDNSNAPAADPVEAGPSPTDILHHQLVELLGEGPLRFAPPRSQPTLEDQLATLDRKQSMAVSTLTQRWDDRQDKLVAKYGWSNRGGNRKKDKNIMELPIEWHLRYLYLYRFQKDKAWAAEKKLTKRFVHLNIHTLVEQIQTKTLFPIPQLRTKDGHSMFYMRPSRFVPHQTTTKTIINNLCYVMNTMVQNNAHACQHGIGFMACMDDWKMANFEVNYCYQFMMALQGFMVPIKVQLFLIVNPPSWFGIIWKIMKPMLAPAFRKRVKICPEAKLAKYLMNVPHLEQFLPDDMQTGKADTDSMVRDFITYRQYVEQNVSVSNGSLADGNSDGKSVVSSGQQSGSHHSSHYKGSDNEAKSLGLHCNSSCESDSIIASISLNSSNSGLSLGNDDDDDDNDEGDDDDEASIHCDISDEEHDDVKQSAVANELLNRSTEFRVYGTAWR